MKLISHKLALAFAVLLVGVQSAQAQVYPLPGKSSAAPVLCTNCAGTNVSGQSNVGLKTWPYSGPLVNHVGRIVSSPYTGDFMSGIGVDFRTARSRLVRIARNTRGAAPPRAYIQIGSALGAFSLDRFFTTTLPQGLRSVKEIAPSVLRGSAPTEEITRWDAFVYPELNAGGGSWTVQSGDGQDRFYDFDFDDRGYVYLALGGYIGLGIVRDDGRTNGEQLPLVAQVLQTQVDPVNVVVVKSGTSYYAVIASSTGRVTYNVTNPASPLAGTKKPSSDTDTRIYGISCWAKDDAHERIAIQTAFANKIEVYDYTSFVTGGMPIRTLSAPNGKKYGAVTVDDDGNFWTTEASGAPETGNRLVKLDRSSGYSERQYDVFGGPFTTVSGLGESRNSINYGDRYLTVVGRVANGSSGNDVRLFKIEGGDPVPVDLAGFFAKYYYSAPRDYAQPNPANLGTTYGAHPVKWGSKTYLIHSTNGLGDVFELQAGDSITATQKTTASIGTTNVYSKSPANSGPYYADILTFNSKSSNPSFEYDVTWNFDNPESLTKNTQASRTNRDETHQFTGLDTTAEILTSRHVTATSVTNSSMMDAVDVTLKVPTARIGVTGLSTAITADGSSLTLVAGDQLTDASDGVVEGHYSQWTIDSQALAPQKPNVAAPASSVGPHTATLAAKYGVYDAGFSTTGSPYVDTVSSLSYEVRPFVIAFGTASPSGSSVTFRGTSRTAAASVLPATTWTVEWSLKNGAVDVTPPPPPAVVPVGQIPDFVVANRSAIPSGSVLKLRVFVAPTGLATGIPVGYAEQVITESLVIPDPAITKTGCANTGSACAFTATSVLGNSTSNWTLNWTLTRDGNPAGSFTGSASEQFKPSLTQSGSYTVSVTASTTVFDGNASLGPFTVNGPICGDPPTASQVAIYTSCSSCTASQSITFRADYWGYTPQGCEEFIWAFGDGGSATSTSRSTTHAYAGNGTYTATLVVRKGGQNSPTFSATITVGPPPPVCTAPTNVTITYSGSKGCRPGVPCKNNESVKFTAYRNDFALSPTCDSAEWSYGDGGSSFDPSPSHTFSSEGTFNVTVNVSNSKGQASGNIDVTVVPDVTSCDPPATSSQAYVDFTGATSGCTRLNAKICKANEVITFKARPYLGSKIQACDQFQWTFGDNGTSSVAEPTHSYAGTQNSYRVTMRIYNSANTAGNTLTADVPFAAAPVLPVPKLSYSAFPSGGTKGNVVSFTVTSDISATGWVWTFGDGDTDSTHASNVGVTNTITHTYLAKGTYTVTVKARNSQDTSTAEMSQVDRPITIDDIPEYRYLIPVVAHANGIGSVWRTDIQIYTSDTSVSPAKPLALTASYKGVTYPLSMPKSTLILEDILDTLRPGEAEQGSMIIAVKTQLAPQIWSRTYNQTGAGTFGQFIPAILLNETGGGSAVGEGKYYLAGLKSDARYRTNVGLVNPNGQAITAIVKLYDDLGLVGQPLSRSLSPFQLDQFPVTGRGDRPFSVEIEVPEGTWVIGYASLIDGGSGDPVYMSAIRASELGSTDYRETVLPGVGHVGDWRSDVTVYNSDAHTVTVDLAYHDAAGAKIGEAKSIPIKAGEFLQYSDILKQGLFGNAADGVGMLRVTVPSTVVPEHYPMAVARTYNDNGSGKTYGQGISGFASTRANVRAGKSALIPGVRDNEKYYTNIGLTNVSSTVATVVVKVLDPNSGSEVADSARTYPLQPNQSVVGRQDLKGRANASLRIEVTGGNVWAFASIIDWGTKDPEYVPATPLP